MRQYSTGGDKSVKTGFKSGKIQGWKIGNKSGSVAVKVAFNRNSTHNS